MKKIMLLPILQLSFITSNGQDSLQFARRFHLGFENGGGAGNKFLYTGIVTNTGQDVIIYEGGGMPLIRFNFGYTYRKHYDVTVSYGLEETTNIPFINNGSVIFDKMMLNAEFRYIFIRGKNRRNHINTGAAFVDLLPSDLTADLSQIDGRYHEIYHFGNALGIKVMLEYDLLTKRRRFAFGLGAEYLAGDLHLRSVIYDGTEMPLSILPSDAAIRNVDVTSTNGYIRFAWYLPVKRVQQRDQR